MILLPRLFFTLTCLFVIHSAAAQTFDAARFRELREKMRSGALTESEQVELDAINKARVGDGSPADREAMRKKRMDEYAERQGFVFERSRQFQKEALAAAALRKAPDGPAHEYFVNNEAGDDNAGGLSAEKSVKTLAKSLSGKRM